MSKGILWGGELELGEGGERVWGFIWREVGNLN